jgi:hypothetical protein
MPEETNDIIFEKTNHKKTIWKKTIPILKNEFSAMKKHGFPSPGFAFLVHRIIPIPSAHCKTRFNVKPEKIIKRIKGVFIFLFLPEQKWFL